MVICLFLRDIIFLCTLRYSMHILHQISNEPTGCYIVCGMPEVRTIYLDDTLAQSHYRSLREECSLPSHPPMQQRMFFQVSCAYIAEMDHCKEVDAQCCRTLPCMCLPLHHPVGLYKLFLLQKYLTQQLQGYLLSLR
jgi:hypothetical protein